MKKIYIIIISVFVLVFIGIVVVNKSSKSYDFNKITKTFLNTHAKDKVNSVEVYRGENLYYIIDFEHEKKDYVGVLDKKKKLILEVNKNDLFDLEKKNKSIGYKYDKLIYEVKKSTKDGFTYYYYNALTGEFIKKIVVDK